MTSIGYLDPTGVDGMLACTAGQEIPPISYDRKSAAIYDRNSAANN